MHADLCLAGIACLAAAFTATAATPALPQVALIAADGNLPFGSALRPGVNAIDLDHYGYVEQEYLLSGTAAVRDSGGAVVAAGEPYVTRILIRRPRDARKFSGKVIVTPFNWDKESAREWGYTKQYLLRSGDVFVGLTAVRYEEPGFYGPNGIKMLQAYAPVRYAALQVFDDHDAKRQDMPQTQDILAQLAFLLKSSDQTNPLYPRPAQRIIAFSEGILAEVLQNYVAQGRQLEYRMPDGRSLYDGFLLGAYHLLPEPPAATRANAIYIIVQHERELHRDIVARVERPTDSDKPGFRLYEFVGSPHIGEAPTGVAGEHAAGNSAPEIPVPPASPTATRPDSPLCKIVNDEPTGLVFAALLDALKRWSMGGAAMPRAARVESGTVGEKVDAATGNALGGLRPPWITVPAASYPPAETVGCGSHEPKIPYTAEKLVTLYGSFRNYQRLFERARSAFVTAGFLLPEDADKLRPTADSNIFSTPR